MKGTPDSQAFPSEIVAYPHVQTSLFPSGGDRKFVGSAVTIRSGDLPGILSVSVQFVTKMPADVASCSRTPFLQKEVDYGYHTSPEMMNGYMTLSTPGRQRQPVHVKVYRTSLEHFAVVSPQKKICRPLGVLNLKNTLVEQLPAESKQPGFMVRQKGFDSPTCLTFVPETPMDLEDWIVAFTCRSSPTLHQSSLPIVEEDEEV